MLILISISFWYCFINYYHSFLTGAMYRQAVVVFAFQDNFQIIQGLVSFYGLLKKICQKINYLLNAHTPEARQVDGLGFFVTV